VNEHRLRIPLVRPVRGVTHRDVTLLNGPAGWGECSPLPGYPCDPALARRAAEEAACEGWPPAVRETVPVNALVPDGPIDGASLAGFSTVKVKLDAPHDVERVAELRDLVGPTVAIRVDANGAWDVDTAVDVIERLGRYDVELIEQPVATIDDLARVRRKVTVPIAVDESLRSLDDARDVALLEAADVVVLKVQPLGGVRAAIAVAGAAGLPAIVTSMLETSVGLAAGLALAAALPELPYACGLGTAALLAGDVVADPLVPVDGVLAVRRPAPVTELIARYEVTEP
jgi:O-succinylbenzoate synthase